jgi:hypothetical protein
MTCYSDSFAFKKNISGSLLVLSDVNVRPISEVCIAVMESLSFEAPPTDGRTGVCIYSNMKEYGDHVG